MGRPGLVGTMARTAVVAGTATAVSGGMQQRSAQKAAAQQQSAAAEQQAMVDQAAAAPAAPAAAGMSMDDKIAKIKELGQLKDAGLLTEDEFSAAKTKLLAG
jgi:hypothetical protein